MKRRNYSIARSLDEPAEKQGAMSCYLSSSDQPVTFSVHIEPTPDNLSALFIDLAYPSAMEEHRQSLTVGDTTIEVGIHSGRLFRLSIGVWREDGETSATAAQRIVDSIEKAFDHLRKTATRIGPRLNYAASRRGLAGSPELSGPPGWLQDALHSLRPGRNSFPPR